MSRLWLVWALVSLCLGCTKRDEQVVEKRTLRDRPGQLPSDLDATRLDTKDKIPDTISSQEGSPTNLSDESNIVFAATRAALVPCDASANGKLFIIEDEQAFVICDSGSFREVLPGALATGLSSIATEEIAAGEECLFGGIAVIAFNDANRDGVLGPGENSSRKVICALQGPSGPKGDPGLAGAALGIIAELLPIDGDECGGNGVHLKIFSDTNGNGAIDDGEAILSQPTVCNGVNGQNGVNGVDGVDGIDGQSVGINTTIIAAGESCGNGGMLITLFTDENRNGAQDNEEPTLSTQAVCNGKDGEDGSGGDPIVCKQIKVDPMKELIAVDAATVEDNRAMPGGKWHFGSLIRQMLPINATPAEVTSFVRGWLETWGSDVVIGTSTAKARTAINSQIICPWVNASFNHSGCEGNIDLDKAPFRLLAIVNRLDLGNGDTVAGEGRFVFAALNAPTTNPVSSGSTKLFTVIFEYDLPVAQHSPQEWAVEWHKLGKLPCDELQGCEAYNAHLESITDKFSSRGKTPDKPNGNPLNQLRTNEIALAGVWELREFQLTEVGGSAQLKQVDVKQTPNASFDGTAELAQFAEDNKAEVAVAKHTIPESMQAASALVPFGFPGWDLPGASAALQKEFSKNTCNGCHHSDTDTIDLFYHISPSQNPGIGRLSKFLREELNGLRKDNLEQVALPPVCRDL